MMFDPATHPLSYQANLFAAGAHAAVNQRRKYTDEPYINHPRAVAQCLMNAGHQSDLMIAAALLHDVIEDTEVAAEDIAREFKHHLQALFLPSIVQDLTNEPRSTGTRQERKAIDRVRLAISSAYAQTIKCADIICNARGISAHDKRFGRIYLKECIATLMVLDDADIALRSLAFKTCKVELDICSGSFVPLRSPSEHAIKLDIIATRSYALDMWLAMAERCKTDKEYRTKFNKWLNEGGTVELRDELCYPFQETEVVSKFNGQLRYPYHEIWTAIDTIRHNQVYENLAYFKSQEAQRPQSDD